MGDTGVHAFTHLLQINRNLQTIYFDRNLLSLNNFEEIVNAMKEYVFLFAVSGNRISRIKLKKNG